MSEKQVDKSESEQIWNEIKDLPISMFALPNQTVKQHIVGVPLPGRKDLVVKMLSTAALPSLEESLANRSYTKGRKYEVEVAEGYAIVRRASNDKEEIEKALAARIPAPFVVLK